MGGVVCAKAAMDGRARVDADVSNTLSNLNQVLDCLQTTIMAYPALTVDDEMEEMMLKAGERFQHAVKEAANAYATIATGLEKQARKKWPKEGNEKYSEGG